MSKFDFEANRGNVPKNTGFDFEANRKPVPEPLPFAKPFDFEANRGNIPRATIRYDFANNPEGYKPRGQTITIVEDENRERNSWGFNSMLAGASLIGAGALAYNTYRKLRDANNFALYYGMESDDDPEMPELIRQNPFIRKSNVLKGLQDEILTNTRDNVEINNLPSVPSGEPVMRNIGKVNPRNMGGLTKQERISNVITQSQILTPLGGVDAEAQNIIIGDIAMRDLPDRGLASNPQAEKEAGRNVKIELLARVATRADKKPLTGRFEKGGVIPDSITLKKYKKFYSDNL